ncbi:hypothetical protein U6A24_05115 [Aquimarina gracilis]|uniref:Lactobin A/cerein 7B family class IIb bacteriocin n=1 Tax=Aquimarina gracilis TaxID=874422 RepID=A0ABU5ZTW3_9FLAO|nr:hypothetical protein [Aquimarina gracilis]MEB3344827.1 hypothetical protein [Aquimarina gracilis]
MKLSLNDLQASECIETLDQKELNKVHGGNSIGIGYAISWGVAKVAGWFDDSDEYVAYDPCDPLAAE